MDDAVWVPPFAYGGLTSGPVGIENVIDASVNVAYPPRVFPPRIRNPHEPRAAVEHSLTAATRGSLVCVRRDSVHRQPYSHKRLHEQRMRCSPGAGGARSKTTCQRTQQRSLLLRS
jgi:hypothetical protein